MASAPVSLSEARRTYNRLVHSCPGPVIHVDGLTLARVLSQELIITNRETERDMQSTRAIGHNKYSIDTTHLSQGLHGASTLAIQHHFIRRDSFAHVRVLAAAMEKLPLTRSSRTELSPKPKWNKARRENPPII